ncbi:MAG TPA: ABC transporter substrate-binding protein [Chromatiales bacterium]|nr:ABC transporter substrate-binding protein [Chromatiales bacterium]
MVLRVFALCLLGWATVSFALAETGPADDPKEMVRQTIERMLALLEERRPEMEKSPGRIYGVVDEVVVPKFDFKRISRYALGRYWRRATPEQRKAFTDEFKNLLIRTYATSLLNYTGQKIEYLPTRPGKNPDSVTVMTVVREEGGPKVPINYRLHRVEGKWLVYDVVIDGVSLVSNYRSSFASKIRRVKIDGLIVQLRQKNQQAM